MIFPRLSHGFPMVPNHQPVIDILSKHLEDFSATGCVRLGMIPDPGCGAGWWTPPLLVLKSTISIYLSTIYLSIYLSIYIYVCVYIYMYMCICVYIYMYVYVYIYIYISVVSILMCVLLKSAYCWISWKLPHEISLTSWPGSISIFQHTHYP